LQESKLSDPIAAVIAMLRPTDPFSKLVNASGQWRVRREGVGKLYYCMTLAGRACLEVDAKPPVLLGAGEFVMVPEALNFTMSSIDPAPSANLVSVPQLQPDSAVRIGACEPAEVQLLVGYCSFASADASLLVSLLPDIVVVRGEQRLGVLAGLIRDETLANRAARDMVLDHLLQLLLVEALRSTGQVASAPGLLRGLADPRLAVALRAIHGDPSRGWTVADLAGKAALSRSAFFNRFRYAVGVAPIEYLTNWRMSVAKRILSQGKASVAEVAATVGYGSPSAFNTAFARQVGRPPARFAQEAAATMV
jgi:AraC-like DNA-binding protein